MSTPAKKWVYLDRKPGSTYKQLFVKGRNIRATTLYDPTVMPGVMSTPEEVARDHDVPLEVVLEAIEYVKSDPPEIREDWEREERLIEATGMNHPDYYKPGFKRKVLSTEELGRILSS